VDGPWAIIPTEKPPRPTPAPTVPIVRRKTLVEAGAARLKHPGANVDEIP
jgi:hypothetical protein